MKQFTIAVNFTNKPIQLFDVNADNNAHAIMEVLKNLDTYDKNNIVTIIIS